MACHLVVDGELITATFGLQHELFKVAVTGSAATTDNMYMTCHRGLVTGHTVTNKLLL